jgi:predicted short-subunit dehydrogenase-like oxidoreductase (DUF2520 family)
VKRDRAGNYSAPIQRNFHRAALEPIRGSRTRCEADCRVRLAGRGQRNGQGKPQEETTTHEARQSSTAGVPFLCPVSATELELRVFESVKIIGSGRVGSAVSARLRERGLTVGDEGQLVLLCVPDDSIVEAAAAIEEGPWVAHVSGATPLSALDPHRRRFSVHPLQTFTRARGPEQLDGAWAAVTADSDEARAAGFWLAETLGLQPFELADDARPLYHAAAAIASNYLVTLHEVASELFVAAGAPPEALVPLMRRTIDNDFELTGPISRGDWTTVEAHRRAIREVKPELEPLYDVLADVTAK